MSEWWTPTSTLNHQQHWASHWTHLRWTLGAARDPTFEFFNSKKVEIGHYLHWLSHAAEKLNCREIEDASTHSLERVYCPLSLSYTRALTSNICFHFSSSFRAHSNCLSLTSTRTFRPQTSFIHRPTAPPCGWRPVAQPFPQIVQICGNGWVSRIKYKSTNSRKTCQLTSDRFFVAWEVSHREEPLLCFKYQKHGDVLNKEVVSVESAGCSHTRTHK